MPTKDLSGQLWIGETPFMDVLFQNTGEYSGHSLGLLGMSQEDYKNMKVGLNND